MLVSIGFDCLIFIGLRVVASTRLTDPKTRQLARAFSYVALIAIFAKLAFFYFGRT
jgi:hypothetical protein